MFWKWRDAKETKQNAFRCKKKGNKTVRTWLLDTILGCDSQQVRWILNAIKAGDMTGGAPVLRELAPQEVQKAEGRDEQWPELCGALHVDAGEAESEWLSTHLHLERVERLCVKVHREREKALKANPHAVFI